MALRAATKGRLRPPPRAELETRAVATVGKVRWYRPRVRVITLPDGARAVLKDFRPCPLLWRATYGRWLTRRETRAYERIDGLDGFPRFLGRVDRYAVMIEWRAGTCIGKCPPGSLRVETFRRLRERVDAMHERGIVHMDLRNKKNVLVDAGGEPTIIDFSSAFVLDTRTRLGRALLRRLRSADITGVLKNQRRYVPDSLTPEDRAELRRFERWRRFWPF